MQLFNSFLTPQIMSQSTHLPREVNFCVRSSGIQRKIKILENRTTIASKITSLAGTFYVCVFFECEYELSENILSEMGERGIWMWYNIFMWENFVYFLCCDIQLIAGHLRQIKLQAMTIFSTISQINQNSNFLYPSQLHSLRCLLFAVQNIWCVSSIYYRSESERKKVVVVVKRRLLSKLYVNCVKKERESF